MARVEMGAGVAPVSEQSKPRHEEFGEADAN
jgi:hypothetical protein